MIARDVVYFARTLYLSHNVLVNVKTHSHSESSNSSPSVSSIDCFRDFASRLHKMCVGIVVVARSRCPTQDVCDDYVRTSRW